MTRTMTKIEYVCGLKHAGEDVNPGPTVTLNQACWAYCRAGGLRAHEWRRISAASVSDIQISDHHRTATV